MDEKSKKLALAKAKAKALQMQADADANSAPAQADVLPESIGSGATGGPAGNYANPTIDPATEDERNRARANISGADTARSFLAGMTADANTGIARALGDKEAAAGAQKDQLARFVGQVVSPLNKIGGGSLGAQMLNAGGQAAVSGGMRGQDIVKTAADTALSAGAPLVMSQFAKLIRGKGPDLQAAELAKRKAVSEVGSLAGRDKRWTEDTLSDPERTKALLDAWREAREGKGVLRTAMSGPAPIAENLKAANQASQEAFQAVESNVPSVDLESAIKDVESRIASETASGQSHSTAELRVLLDDLKKAWAQQNKMGSDRFMEKHLTAPEVGNLRRQFATMGSEENAGRFIPGSTPEGAAKAADQASSLITEGKLLDEPLPGQLENYQTELSRMRGVNDAADAAATASQANASRPSLGLMNPSPKGVAAAAGRSFIGKRFDLGMQAWHDKAMQKALASPNPGLQRAAQWIEEATEPTTRAVRSFVVAKQNPEFLKMIQEGDKDE